MFVSTTSLSLVLAVSAGSLVLLLCVVQLRDRKRKGRRYPPGPFSIPFFGPLHWGTRNEYFKRDFYVQRMIKYLDD